MIKNINHRMQYFYKTVKGVSVFHVGVLGFFALRLTYTFRNYLGKFLNFKPDKKTFPKISDSKSPFTAMDWSMKKLSDVTQHVCLALNIFFLAFPSCHEIGMKHLALCCFPIAKCMVRLLILTEKKKISKNPFSFNDFFAHA